MTKKVWSRPELKKVWNKPALSTLSAGYAEKGSANNRADGPNPQKS
jgi:hypothetical protein